MHVGSLAGVQEISLPSAVLRSKDISIRGSGPGNWQVGGFLKELPALLEALKRAPSQGVRVVPLSEVEREWVREGGERVVFAVGGGGEE